MNARLFRCHKRASPCRYFTDGRVYAGAPVGAGRVFVVRDDAGNPRLILPGGPCAHLPPPLREFGPPAHWILGGFWTEEGEQ
jgi:hypothetical protein